ncbi:anti-sigma-I factor RsgI family protein [Cohnella thailandensis]|uniref:Anti-sigma factor domain-containing protein n=1 Tax=Cohnella thailandensis TaxID=557557 RepID=A0A841SVL1_9BACL|nr:anti-sigma factor domain-containing protein [Cohnella thailandensis]MBB6633657.1 anti-sigma factor domain-containing protein [Cohnella thailandensis]MBP1976442.1 hypothetical protein [Cohnella thailandensis]
MSKAIVMSLKGRRAVVLAQGGRFVMVPREKHYQIGDEIEFEAEEVRSLPRTASGRRVRWAAGAGGAAVLCLLLFGGLWLRTPPVVAYVTMDVNPSVELGVDGKDRVRQLRAVNPDAIPIIEGIDYKGESLESVTDQIVDKLASLKLLEGEDAEVVLTTVPVGKVDEEWESEISEMIKHSIEEAGASAGTAGTSEGTAKGNGEGAETAETTPVVTTVSVPKEVREQANAKGVSAGKMAFWLKAESQGHRVPLQKLKSESLNQISSSWGGVSSVLKESEDKDKIKSDEEWRELVSKAQEKEKKRQEAREKKQNSAKDDKGKTSNKPKAEQKPGTAAGGKENKPSTAPPAPSSSPSAEQASVSKNGAKAENGDNAPKATNGTSNRPSSPKDPGKNKPWNGKSEGNRWGREDQDQDDKKSSYDDQSSSKNDPREEKNERNEDKDKNKNGQRDRDGNDRQDSRGNNGGND